MNLFLEDFLIIILAYLLTKFGYLVLFNNFFHLISLKGKKAKGTYLDKFSKVFGYALIVLGLFTAALLFIRRMLADYYLQAYLTVVLIVMLFLVYKYFSYKNEERKTID